MIKENLQKLLNVRLLFNLTLISLFTLTLNVAVAVPAYPHPITIVQADGTELIIQKHGDEFFNWTTTTSGHTIQQKDGNYYYVTYSGDGKVQFTNQKVSQARSRSGENAFLSNFAVQNMSAISAVASTARRRAMFAGAQKVGFPNKGDIKAIIILIEYQDVKFTVSDPHTAFTNQLNKPSYSVAGAVGSAKDYFSKASGGEFNGQFDVAGPYTLSREMAYYGGNDYGGNDRRPQEMVEEAVRLADGDVDFSQYDFDNNGEIDNVFVYYAGNNEAEGGPDDSIWPHKWAIFHRPSFDGKQLYGYACTSELRGGGGTIAGIGTFVHEFSHVFGLADHYDTNGHDDGYSEGLGYYDIMTSGGYNNNGNSPPMFNALEIEMIGWLDPIVLETTDTFDVPTIDHHVAYKILTDVPGEYFLIENRQTSDPNNVWDNHIPGDGLMITHVDRSAYALQKYWAYNRPNTNTSHECFKIIPASNNSYWSNMLYPYAGNNAFNLTTTPKAVSWSGQDLECTISNISESGLDMTITTSQLVRPTSIEITQESVDMVATVGIPMQLMATVLPIEAIHNSVRWSTSNSTFATVSVNGLVNFLDNKEVTITATNKKYENISESLTFTPIIGLTIEGIITDSFGTPVEGAQIRLTPVVKSITSAGTLSVQKIEVATTRGNPTIIKSNAKGEFFITVTNEGAYQMTVNKGDYIDYMEVFDIQDSTNKIDVQLTAIIEIESNYKTWSNNEFGTNSVGNGGNSFHALSTWSSEDLKNNIGSKITKVRVGLAKAATIRIVIFNDLHIDKPIFSSKSIPATQAGWVTLNVPLEDQVSIEGGKNYTIGYELVEYAASANPAALSSNAAIEGEGNLIFLGEEVKTLEGKDGNWLIGFYLQNDEHLGINTIVGQVDAELSWKSRGYTSFKITYKKIMTSAITINTTLPKHEFTRLSNGTTYDVVVSGSSDDATYTEMFSTSFTTIKKVTDFPVILLRNYVYKANTPIPLKAINLNSKDSVIWRIDGSVVEGDEVVLEPGIYKIKATVTRGAEEYVAVKTISVEKSIDE